MTQHSYVDIAPHIRQQAQSLHNRAGDIRRILGQHLAPPEMVKGAKRALNALRAEALALSREL